MKFTESQVLETSERLVKASNELAVAIQRIDDAVTAGEFENMDAAVVDAEVLMLNQQKELKLLNIMQANRTRNLAERLAELLKSAKW